MNFFKNPNIKVILSAITIAGFGFILLNLTFLFDWLFQSSIRLIINPFIPINNPEISYNWFPPMMHGLFLVVIGLISWLIFKSKLGTLYKAIFMTVPSAVIFVTLGIFFYHWPIIPYLISGLLGIGVFYYFYQTKQPWLYYFSVIIVGLALIIMNLTGVEI